jgi:ribosomal protein L40E
MLKSKSDNRLINCLVCWKCGGRTNPNHFVLKDGGAICVICNERNPLGQLRKLTLQEVNATSEIIVAFTRSGTAAHGLHTDCKTALGPWVNFASGDVLDRALVYLGATEEQIEDYRSARRRWGQGSSHIRLSPMKRNLLRLDYLKL